MVIIKLERSIKLSFTMKISIDFSTYLTKIIGIGLNCKLDMVMSGVCSYILKIR